MLGQFLQEGLPDDSWIDGSVVPSPSICQAPMPAWHVFGFVTFLRQGLFPTVCMPGFAQASCVCLSLEPRYPLEHALSVNALLGGDSAARGVVLGMLLGVSAG